MARARAHAEPQLTENALTVLKARYLWRGAEGEPAETPRELYERVARFVASAEGRSSGKWAEQFYDLMASCRFLPNTPTLINAGKKKGQLSACFVLPIEDSLDGIFDSLKAAAKIHQSGGGTGFAFSKLRPAGSIVSTTHGVASGPVSFMRIFDIATETVKQGGARRGANMAVLRVDHPDIVEFIDCKRDLKSVTNFNISVGATDEFMRAVMERGKFKLLDPSDGSVVREVDAHELFSRLVRSAWECGDPGMVFLDRMNRLNPTPSVGEFESTNPCGEQPLLPYESCNLGSINLGAYVKKGGLDWVSLGNDIDVATRFLDNIIDLNAYPLLECARITKRNRKIGLGVMGFADMLLGLGVSYAEPKAVEWAERIMSFLDRRAKQASMKLAREKGAFPNWKGSMWDRLDYPKLRNATVSTIAPTGTISIIAGASSGIEPIFSAYFFRNVLSGRRLSEIHPAVEKALRARGLDPAAMNESDAATHLGAAWSPASTVPVEQHVRVQAAFQRHSDSAVSKTINLSRTAIEKDVEQAYLQAYLGGCKGITVYRDGSRPTQVLERSLQKPEPMPAAACEDCN